MCKAKCPQCGFEFEVAPPQPIVNARWTEAEDAALLRAYQVDRKTIAQIAEEMNRTQDAVRNHLHALRGAARGKQTVVISVSMSAQEYDDLRAATERATENHKKARRAERDARDISTAAYMLLKEIERSSADLPPEIKKKAASLEKTIHSILQDETPQKTFL